MATPTLQLGAAEGTGPEVFHNVEDLHLLSGRGIAVLDRGADELRLFDASGGPVAVVGGSGRGPREFRDPIGIDLVPPDSIAVFDWQLDRVTLFGVDGTFGRTILLTPPPPNPVGYFEQIDTGDGFIVAATEYRPPSGAQLIQRTVDLLMYDRFGALIDTVASLPHGRLGWVDEERREAGRPLLEPRGTFAASGSRVFTATGAESELRILSETGELLETWRWESDARPLSEKDVDFYRARRMAEIPPHLRERLRREFATMPVHEELPVLDRLLADDDGGAWVGIYPYPQATQRDGCGWMRLDATGEVTCTMSVPRSYVLHDVRGGFAAVLSHDSLGLAYVSVHRVEGY